MAGFRFALILAVCLFLPRESISHSAGAPTEQCDAMTPSHDGKSAQSGAAPFSITANAATYQCGDTITVSLAATTANFTGFLCQARTDTNNYDTTVGTLAASGSVMMTENCGTGRGLTHAESSEKTGANFAWTAMQDYGSVTFVCTVVKVKAEFWVKETSSAITYVSGGQCSGVSHVAASVGLILLLIIARRMA